MQHFLTHSTWNEDCRIHRLHPENVKADTQLLDFTGGPAAEVPIEIGLALEIWRVRGCPEAGMMGTARLAAEIVRAGEWST
jgi:hypothetical protein